MGTVMLLIVIGTSLWVLYDAKKIGVKKGQIKGLANMGPWGWFFATLLIWIVGFPLYITKRGEFKKVNSVFTRPSTMQTSVGMKVLKGFGLFAGIIAAVVVITAIAAWWNNQNSVPSNSAPTIADTTPVIKTSALKILTDYHANEIAADEKYKNKIVQISGYIYSIEKDMLNKPFLTIGVGEADEAYFVHASFNNKYQSLLARLQRGQKIIIKCTINGLILGDVQGEDCSIP